VQYLATTPPTVPFSTQSLPRHEPPNRGVTSPGRYSGCLDPINTVSNSTILLHERPGLTRPSRSTSTPLSTPLPRTNTNSALQTYPLISMRSVRRGGSISARWGDIPPWMRTFCSSGEFGGGRRMEVKLQGSYSTGKQRDGEQGKRTPHEDHQSLLLPLQLFVVLGQSAYEGHWSPVEFSMRPYRKWIRPDLPKARANNTPIKNLLHGHPDTLRELSPPNM
jgi:hypothetical protein